MIENAHLLVDQVVGVVLVGVLSVAHGAGHRAGVAPLGAVSLRHVAVT